jgi:hypothetical protein
MIEKKRRKRRQPAMCRCIYPNNTVQKIDWQEAVHLCEGGHAKWKRTDLIELLPNLHFGPAMSLRVGGLLAFLAQTKANRDWARVMISNICDHKGIS